MNKRIWLSSPHLGGNEQKYVEEAFSQNWVAPLGPNVDGFESDIKAYFGGDFEVAAVSSGTAALHLALIQLGVDSGDEVICQSMTFSASANPIVYQGATPVFVGSEAETWNMSPSFLRNAIRERCAKGIKPKAIVVVALYGMPAKMDEIMEIASEYSIPIIEDAAEAFGSMHKSRFCGTFGRYGILSFNGNKIITSSGGGALVCPSKREKEYAIFLATQARDSAPHYQHSTIGYNYRMSNIVAGIGRGQMEVLDQRVRQRRAVYERYLGAFANLSGIFLPREPEGFFSNRWLTTILVNPSETGGVTREDIRLALEADNIESRPLWKPMHLQPVFKDCPYYGDGTSERLFQDGLCLPSGSNMPVADQQRVIDKVKACLIGKTAVG